MLNPSSTEIAVKKIALLLLVGATLLSANVAEEEAAVPQLHIDNETPEDYVANRVETATSSPASTFPTRNRDADRPIFAARR